jgi:hypothetical protein
MGAKLDGDGDTRAISGFTDAGVSGAPVSGGAKLLLLAGATSMQK